MLAFSIALLLDMPRPYWAMASVYITSNLLTGATHSKAVYRILGTLAGAAGTIVLVPNLVDAPELFSLAIALWVGICLYLSLIDGTPRGYAFMLAGYTVAFLAFPVVSTPQATFDIVVARVQEITLGIICASVVAMLVLPRSVASVFAAQADAWLAGARRLGVDVLTDRGSNQERDNERLRLAAAASEIDELGRHLDYEAASANIVRSLQVLRQHMLSLLPLLGSIEDRKLALNPHEEASVRIAGISTRTARWLEAGGHDEREADALRAALDEVRPALDANAGWTDITVAGLVVRLRNLVDVMQDCRLLCEAIAGNRNPDSIRLAFTPDAPTAAVMHRDHGPALLTAASVALSVLACSGFAIATGWVDGVSAPLFAAVLGSLLAGVDDPLPTFRNLYGLLLVVIAVSGIYLFAVLPRVTTLEVLIAALMPTFVLFGWMAARPATARVGSMLAILTSVQLALEFVLRGQFPFVRQRQRRADAGCRAYRRCLRHRSLARSRLDRKSIDPKQLDNARCGRRTQVALGSRRDCRSDAASPGPACGAGRSGSCRGEKRRRQSSPASSGSWRHRRQAGERRPVTPHKSGDRRIPRSSCQGLPEPGGQPASGSIGGTARQHDRIHAAGIAGRGARSGADRTCRRTCRAFPGFGGIPAARSRTQENCRMKYQLDLFGVIVPSLLLWGVLAYALARLVSKLIARTGLYRRIWHPALFDFALYICLVASLVFASKEFFS